MAFSNSEIFKKQLITLHDC